MSGSLQRMASEAIDRLIQARLSTPRDGAGARPAPLLAMLFALTGFMATPAQAELGGAPTLPVSAQKALSTAAVTASLSSTRAGVASTGTATDSATNVATSGATSGATSRATSATASAAAPTTYTMRAAEQADGTTIREYLNVDGTVFALAWNGPFIPDLQALMGGTAFSEFIAARQAQATQAAAPRSLHGAPPAVNASDLVVETSGHPRAYQGRAWRPSLLPSGFDTTVIQ